MKAHITHILIAILLPLEATISRSFGQQYTLQPGPGSGKDIWTTSVYSYAPGGSFPGGGLNDSQLRVGGWGDQYNSLLQFNLAGLPQNATSATLSLYDFDSGSGSPVSMYLDRITQAWDWTTMGTGRDHNRLWWADRPATSQWTAGALSAPLVGSWYNINITSLYNAWKSSSIPNYGLQLRPTGTSNQFNDFYSSDYTGIATLRPKLVINVTPNIPTPTSAPLISVFPAADQNFYGGVLQTLQNHSPEFSTDTRAYLSSTTTQLQPLINPGSDTALKKTASFLAFGAKTFGNGLDLASNFTDPGGYFLSGNTTGGLRNAINDVTHIWSLESVAVGQAGVQPPTTNFAPLDILNAKIDKITTLTSSAYSFSHGNVLSGLLSVNAFIYRDMLAPQLEQFTHDPADPNFQTVYLPDMLHLPSLPTTGSAPLDDALSREMQGLANAAQYLKAVNASFDKYAGAIAAGDNLHAALQMEAVLNYLALYNQASQDASIAVTDTQNLIAALGFVGSYDPQKLIDLQSQLAANGFSADVVAYYTGLGYSAADINNLKQDILNLNANSFSANMANVDAQTSGNLLQGTTAAVPEPSTMAMLGIGLFSLGFRRRRSSAAREAGLNPS